MIAGTQSGVGKTTLTLGILGALRRKGIRVQPFKVGPDYIDGSYHTAIAGLPCRNLDAWLLPGREVTRSFARAMAHADLGVIEGVMGLFDGNGRGDRCSSAHIARLLRCPVLLVVDGSASSSSVGAQALGFRHFDPRVRIEGVLVNRVSGAKHASWCAAAIRRAGMRLLGSIPSDPSVALPQRHLGLVPEPERASGGTGADATGSSLRAIVDHVERHVDLERILLIARYATMPSGTAGDRDWTAKASKAGPRPQDRPTIGVAYDSAFHFYYRDGLEALEREGATLRFFSPLAGEFPDCDALYVGGGFPETHLDALEASASTRRIRVFCESGAPVLAECGGLMYLTRGIEDFEGRRGRMVGFLDAETRMVRKLTLAYTIARAQGDTLLVPAGRSVRGHEFHSSTIEAVPRDARFAYRMIVGTGIDGRRDGWSEGGVVASYMHTHLASGSKARRLVDAARAHRRR